jgi:hypothetical protein
MELLHGDLASKIAVHCKSACFRPTSEVDIAL